MSNKFFEFKNQFSNKISLPLFRNIIIKVAMKYFKFGDFTKNVKEKFLIKNYFFKKIFTQKISFKKMIEPKTIN